MSLAFFALSTLELLGALDVDDAVDGSDGGNGKRSVLSRAEKAAYADWIYAQQHPDGGFRGSPFVGLEDPMREPAHIVMSYTALLSLAILGDDLVRLDAASLVRSVQACQTEDGSFAPFPQSPERDVRFVYCAFVLCYLLDAFDSIDVDAAVAYLLRCRSYDYAFGQAPGLEPQGGTSYCALASLHLAGRLQDLPRSERTLDWLVHRQVPLEAHMLDGEDVSSEADPEGDAFLRDLADGKREIVGCQGRPEKLPDACYSFWVGGSIELLAPHRPPLEAPDGRMSREQDFLLLCQSRMGGIAKFPGDYPDIYHTYLAMAALALSGYKGVKPIDVSVNVSQDVLERLKASLTVIRKS